MKLSIYIQNLPGLNFYALDKISLLQEDNSVHTHKEAQKEMDTQCPVQGVLQAQILTGQSTKDSNVSKA